MAISSHALAGARPVPTSLPSLRDRLVYHERHTGARGGPVFPKETEKQTPDSASDPKPEGDHDVDGASIGFEQLSLHVLTVSSAVFSLLLCLNL